MYVCIYECMYINVVCGTCICVCIYFCVCICVVYICIHTCKYIIYMSMWVWCMHVWDECSMCAYMCCIYTCVICLLPACGVCMYMCAYIQCIAWPLCICVCMQYVCMYIYMCNVSVVYAHVYDICVCTCVLLCTCVMCYAECVMCACLCGFCKCVYVSIVYVDFFCQWCLREVIVQALWHAGADQLSFFNFYKYNRHYGCSSVVLNERECCVHVFTICFSLPGWLFLLAAPSLAGWRVVLPSGISAPCVVGKLLPVAFGCHSRHRAFPGVFCWHKVSTLRSGQCTVRACKEVAS